MPAKSTGRGRGRGTGDDLAAEQAYLAGLYARLDSLRDQVSGRLARVLRQAGGTPAARMDREALTAMYRQRLAQFDAAENGLAFGRLELTDGELRYIGRLGLHADGDDYAQLLMDWRAEAARPFYLATAASPGEVKVRRHLQTRGRTLLRLDDEVLDLAHADPTRHEGLTGESALLAALNASRTGSMRDIVATIQAEQDVIIRSGLPGVLVVQGGPGTGKTAVALHRAAYLLYTYRRQLEKRGVLVVGPNATFLRYIGQVLPSLGETSVLLATIGEMFPGIVATGTEPDAVAEVKGRAAMAGVIAAAVAGRQHLPDQGSDFRYESQDYHLSRQALAKARERARRSRLPHNRAAPVFAAEVLTAMTQVVAGRIGADPLGGGNLLRRADMDDLRADLADDPGIRSAISRLWPPLTPEQLLTDLYASPRLLAAAAPSLTREERALLSRQPGTPWTPADVPLLDEAAELLGADDRAARAQARRERRQQEEYARGVLDILGRDEEDDPEVLMAADLVDPGRLAARFADDASLTAAERAAADRTWAFGHVIVDEAQELSPMAWRLVMRRCPVRSMTIVGDVAQTGDPAGASSWQEALGPYMGDRWRIAPLTVNYRTPTEIMSVAAAILAQIDPAAEPPRSVRDTGSVPWRLAAGDAELPGVVACAAQRLAGQLGDGRLAVIGPAGRLEELTSAVSGLLPGASAGPDPDLSSPVVVLSVRQAKGLEFDAVLVADPGMIVAESPRGLRDLYVGLTRATQQAGVIHTADLPAPLAALREAASLAGPG